MRRLWLAVIIGALWCVAVHGGAPAHADPLPPCVDGHYLPGQAGTACQIRGDTTPTARCWDGTFDYSLGADACAGHGGVLRWVLGAQTAAPPLAVPAAEPMPTYNPGLNVGTPTGSNPSVASGRIVHTWYTSSQPQAYLYYCDDDPARLQNDLPQYQLAFPTVSALLAEFPGRTLNHPCYLDGATGP